jgi:hypothetical protein
MDATGGTLTVIGVVLGVLVVSGIVFGVVFVALKRVAQRRREAAHQQYPDARLIDAGALFFGQQSKGVGQMRGNGTLIITHSDIIFQQWVTNQEFRIPLRAIQSLENPTSFLGKWQGVPLLQINFLNDSGQTDAMAWRVRDLGSVQRVIEDARS